MGLDITIKTEKKCEITFVFDAEQIKELFNELEGIFPKVKLDEFNFPILYQMWYILTKE